LTWKQIDKNKFEQEVIGSGHYDGTMQKKKAKGSITDEENKHKVAKARSCQAQAGEQSAAQGKLITSLTLLCLTHSVTTSELSRGEKAVTSTTFLRLRLPCLIAEHFATNRMEYRLLSC